MSLAAIQNHALARKLELPPSARALAQALRNMLLRASNDKRVRTSPREISRLVKQLGEPPPNVAEQLRASGLHANAYCIAGGDKNLKRDPGFGHFLRDDGAWFDFAITVREHSKHLELLAYDFEIGFPPGAGAPFLRLDLNLPAHRNDERELRAHLHPGSDDIVVPAPMMTPTEVLALFLDGLRLSTDRAKPRDLTAFEIGWF